MATLKTLDSSIVSLIILIIIYINAYNPSEKGYLNYNLFINLLRINMFLIVIDILGWVFNGLPGSLNLICNTTFNLLLYIFEPLAATLWVLYVNNQIFHDKNKFRNAAKILLFLLIANAILSTVSIFTGWFFYVNSQNIYARGTYFIVHVAYCYGLLAYALFMIIRNKNLIEKRYYSSLLFFFLPQLIGTTIQMFIYGVSYNWIGAVISILIVYFNIQERGLNLDYLTGAYNRRKLDECIRSKVQTSTHEKSFSAILIDLNHFKQINDNFGHDAGDDALRVVVEILKRSLNKNDFIARFGGDEFVVIMDIFSTEALETVVRILEAAFKDFNNSNLKPYKLSFSIGYDIYDSKSKMTAEDFLKQIDMLMYNHKKKR
jgi:diguanylate cyclase (GGDEF)-like protein